MDEQLDVMYEDEAIEEVEGEDIDLFDEDPDEEWGLDGAAEESTADDGDDGEDGNAAEGQAGQSQGQQEPIDFQAILQAARNEASQQAFMRAQQEKDALVARAYEGQVNPYTGRPINSEAELIAYQQAYQREQMEAAGVTPQVLQQMVENSPVVQQARAITAQNQQVMGRQILNQQIQEIAALDPSIHSLEDITKMPTFGSFDAMVRRGYSMVDAYKLANYEQLSGKRAAAARQQAINQQAGKSHLTSTQGGAGGKAVSVPSDIRAMYREMVPGITDKEIAVHYAKSMRE